MSLSLGVAKHRLILGQLVGLYCIILLTALIFLPAGSIWQKSAYLDKIRCFPPGLVHSVLSALAGQLSFAFGRLRPASGRQLSPVNNSDGGSVAASDLRISV